MDALRDDTLPLETEEPTYIPDHDAEHHPLPTMEMIRAEMQDMIEKEVWRPVGAVVNKCLDEMMTVIIHECSPSPSKTSWNPIYYGEYC